MLIHLASGEDVAIDYRETAPAAATRDMFLGSDGKPDPKKSRDQALGIGVPGTVAGLALALERHGSGRFSLAELLSRRRSRWRATASPSRTTSPTRCRNGSAAAAMAGEPQNFRARRRHAAAARRPADPERPRATLQAIAAKGDERLLRRRGRRQARRRDPREGGILTREDLRSYRAESRTPVRGAIAASTSCRCRCRPRAARC